MGFLKSCSGPPKFKNIRGPLGPGPVGPLVNASLTVAQLEFSLGRSYLLILAVLADVILISHSLMSEHLCRCVNLI